MTLKNVIALTVDLKDPTRIEKPVVTQNDSVVFVLNVFDGGQPFDLSEATTVSLAHIRRDGSVVVTLGTRFDNEATFELQSNETALIGDVNAKAQFYDAEGRVSTLTFKYFVQHDPTSSEYIPSESEQTLIQTVLADGPLRIQEAIDATGYATAQGDYAKAEGDKAKLAAADSTVIPLVTVDTVALRNSTYPNPLHGSLVTVSQGAGGNAETFRFVTGTGWVLVDKYNGTTITNINQQLADMTQLDINNEAVKLGTELLDATGWTSTGWTGNFATGFTHVLGQSTPLIKTVALTAGKLYQVQLRLTPTCQLDGGNGTSDFTITLGGSEPFVTYQGASPSKLYSYGIIAPATGNLVITPEPRYEGTITELSVKEVTGALEPSAVIKDTTGANAFETRPTKETLKNVYIGKNVGRYSSTGFENTILGANSFENSVSGFWNSAVGHMALQKNLMGSRNIAMGYTALQNNISGHRNVALGTFALRDNTHGANNIGIGADSVWENTTGNENIGIGLAALAENLDGDGNIGIGIAALQANRSANHNIGIGDRALFMSVSGDYNIALGYQAGYNSNGGNRNIALGYHSMRSHITGDNNVAIGSVALNKNTNGVNNIAIGGNAMGTGVGESYSIAIGSNAMAKSNSPNGGNIGIGENSMFNNTTGYSNIAFGFEALYNNNTGYQNVAFGAGAGKGSATGAYTRNVLVGYNAGSALTTGGNNNVIIGASSGSTVTSGAGNILIGYNVQAVNVTDNNKLNIGNTIYGDVSSRKIGINIPIPTSNLHLPASTTSPGTSPLKINAGVLMSTVEPGAIEFDGTNLYFTTTSGIRKTVAVV